MALLDPNWNPSQRQLRQFGLLYAPVLPVLSWFWSFSALSITIAFLVGMSIAICAFVVPRLVKPLFIGLTVIAMPIGLVVGELSLLLVFVFVFLPIGFCFRVLRRDRLRLGLERQSASYWKEKSRPKSLRNYYRQF